MIKFWQFVHRRLETAMFWVYDRKLRKVYSAAFESSPVLMHCEEMTIEEAKARFGYQAPEGAESVSIYRSA